MKKYTSAHWGAYEVEGDLASPRLRHFAHDPSPSDVGLHMVDACRRLRVMRPSVRQSWLDHGIGARPELRGIDPFVEVDWDHALDLAAQTLRATIESKGNEAIFGGSYGWASAGRFHHAQSQVHRFLNCIGGYVSHTETYSLGAGRVLLPLVLADTNELLNIHHSWDVLEANTELFVAFGGVPEKNGLVQPGGACEHLVRGGLASLSRRGTRLVNVSPMASSLETVGDVEWIRIRPGTDAAMMLGLAHTIHQAGLHDRTFLASHCVGFDRFEPYLTGAADGQPKDAEWASAICGVPTGRIRDLAMEMTRRRTFLNVSFSLQRADRGEQPYWMLVVLAAMLGQVGLPGGGFGLYGASNLMGAGQALFGAPTLPQGNNPVRDSIPVARIADMLENPGGPYRYRGQSRRYPRIETIYWAGGNPFHHHQDLARLMRVWRTVPSVIVNEPFWTATAKMADIVLPATTTLERNDIGFAARQRFMIAMPRAMETVGEAKDDYEIFSMLAARLGAVDAFTEGLDTEGWLRRIYEASRPSAASAGVSLPDFDAFWEEGLVDVAAQVAPRPVVMFEAFRADPVVSPLKTASGRIEIFSETIAGYECVDCDGHPSWQEPVEWLGSALAARFPIHLLSDQPRNKLHSQLDHSEFSLRDKIGGREPVLMNPADAAARGIADGDVVRLYNDRGACLAVATLSEGIDRSVARISTGAWFDPESWLPGPLLDKHGNPNAVTPDRGTSELSQGCAAQSCLVQVEKYDGTPPPVTAFELPSIVPRERVA